MVTCKYLIFCSSDKYKLLVPHQGCTFAQKRLIELRSTLVVVVGDSLWNSRGLIDFRPRSAELSALLSYHWLSSFHAFQYKLLGLGSNLVGEPAMRLPLPAGSCHSCPSRLVPISPKRSIFSMGNGNSRNQEKKGSFKA